MTDFPTRVNAITSLAERMFYGYSHFGSDFRFGMGARISVARMGYNSARTPWRKAVAAARVAASARQRSLAVLRECMKGLLKKAEADVAGDPVKLAWIGWGPKAAPRPLEAPGEPRELSGDRLEDGRISLSWKRPVGGGSVWSYSIEGKAADSADGSSQWRFLASVYEPAATIRVAEEISEIELRALAGNPAGRSLPSNSVTIAFEPSAAR
jgi:hypothetical protein